MSDDDMIRRGDAVRAAWECLTGFGASEAIRALPARGVGVPTERPDAPAHIVEYTNWRGETARRTIIPIRMWWGSTEWHPQEQWMLTAWDVEKDAPRDFAWQDMRPVQNGATSAAVAALAPTDAPHVNETQNSEPDAGNVLTAAQAREAALHPDDMLPEAIRLIRQEASRDHSQDVVTGLKHIALLLEQLIGEARDD